MCVRWMNGGRNFGVENEGRRGVLGTHTAQILGTHGFGHVGAEFRHALQIAEWQALSRL